MKTLSFTSAAAFLIGAAILSNGCGGSSSSRRSGASGGAPASDGGAPAANGGAPASNGGAPAEDGGAPAANGGAPGATVVLPAGLTLLNHAESAGPLGFKDQVTTDPYTSDSRFCRPNEVLVGFRGARHLVDGGTVVRNVTPVCQPITLEGGSEVGLQWGPRRDLEVIGDIDAPSTGTMDTEEAGFKSLCAEGSVVVGLDGRAGTVVDGMEVTCAPLTVKPTLPVTFLVGTTSTLPYVGGQGGSPQDAVACPAGKVANGVEGGYWKSNVVAWLVGDLGGLTLGCAEPDLLAPALTTQDSRAQPSLAGGSATPSLTNVEVSCAGGSVVTEVLLNLYAGAMGGIGLRCSPLGAASLVNDEEVRVSISTPATALPVQGSELGPSGDNRRTCPADAAWTGFSEMRAGTRLDRLGVGCEDLTLANPRPGIVGTSFQFVPGLPALVGTAVGQATGLPVATPPRCLGGVATGLRLTVGQETINNATETYPIQVAPICSSVTMVPAL